MLSPIDLGVNIDHVATLRNARGEAYPDPVRAAIEAEEAGADLITLHLREDRRHIKDNDLIAIRPILKTRMNLECALTSEMLGIACKILPEDVCIVPEKRSEVTTEGGLNVLGQIELIRDANKLLTQEGIRVSLFIDPDLTVIQACHDLGIKIIELHTGAYANSHSSAQITEFNRIQTAARFAHSLGIKVNAGHGLTEKNVEQIASIPVIRELNIGHSLVAMAIFKGWKTAIGDMKALMLSARMKALT